MELTFDIIKEHSYLFATNPITIYVIGIGETGYTVHKDAEDIQKIYEDKYGIYKNYSINDKNNYHVLQARVQSILEYSKWIKKINLFGKSHKVKKIYLGVVDKVELYIEPAKSSRSTNKLKSKGIDLLDLDEPLKYIIEI